MQYTSTKAANYLGVSVQSLYYAMSTGKLKYFRKGKKYFFDKVDLDNYTKSKWKRDRNHGPEWVSVRQCAEILNLDMQRIYYLIKRGDLTTKRDRGMLFLPRSDLKLNF